MKMCTGSELAVTCISGVLQFALMIVGLKMTAKPVCKMLIKRKKLKQYGTTISIMAMTLVELCFRLPLQIVAEILRCANVIGFQMCAVLITTERVTDFSTVVAYATIACERLYIIAQTHARRGRVSMWQYLIPLLSIANIPFVIYTMYVEHINLSQMELFSYSNGKFSNKAISNKRISNNSISNNSIPNSGISNNSISNSSIHYDVDVDLSICLGYEPEHFRISYISLESVALLYVMTLIYIICYIVVCRRQRKVHPGELRVIHRKSSMPELSNHEDETGGRNQKRISEYTNVKRRSSLPAAFKFNTELTRSGRCSSDREEPGPSKSPTEVFSASNQGMSSVASIDENPIVLPDMEKDRENSFEYDIKSWMNSYRRNNLLLTIEQKVSVSSSNHERDEVMTPTASLTLKMKFPKNNKVGIQNGRASIESITSVHCVTPPDSNEEVPQQASTTITDNTAHTSCNSCLLPMAVIEEYDSVIHVPENVPSCSENIPSTVDGAIAKTYANCESIRGENKTPPCRKLSPRVRFQNDICTISNVTSNCHPASKKIKLDKIKRRITVAGNVGQSKSTPFNINSWIQSNAVKQNTVAPIIPEDNSEISNTSNIPESRSLARGVTSQLPGIEDPDTSATPRQRPSTVNQGVSRKSSYEKKFLPGPIRSRRIRESVSPLYHDLTRLSQLTRVNAIGRPSIEGTDVARQKQEMVTEARPHITIRSLSVHNIPVRALLNTARTSNHKAEMTRRSFFLVLVAMIFVLPKAVFLMNVNGMGLTTAAMVYPFIKVIQNSSFLFNMWLYVHMCKPLTRILEM